MAERQEAYEVQIGVFEGPMDLLLYLVQKNEVSPGQISIAEITDQYLAWIRDISKADLSLAGDFLLMASRLMALKVRELLPKDQQTEAEQLEFEEGREQLMQQMLEYQRFKLVAQHLQQREANQFGVFYRGRPEKTSGDDDTLADANIWQLFRAFQKTLKVHGRENVHTIELDDVTIEDRQQHINNYLARHGRALFEDILGRDRRPLVAVVSFMAMLEMIKTDDIVFRQSEAMGAIWLYRRKNNLDFAEEMASEKLRYSPDPDLKPGLVDLLRSREEALEGQKRVTLDAVMREAVVWANAGRQVSDDVIMGMLEGRVQLVEEVIPTEQNPDTVGQQEVGEPNPVAPSVMQPSVDEEQQGFQPADAGFSVLLDIADAGPQAEFDEPPLEAFSLRGEGDEEKLEPDFDSPVEPHEDEERD